MTSNPIASHLRLKRPCDNCPFRTEGAIELAPGRLDGIIQGMLADDRAPFLCHKTAHSRKGGTWADDGTYEASGNEAMCAGAAAVLMKRGRPTVAMRIAFVTGQASPTQWEHISDEVIE